MKLYSLGISNFLEEISSLSPSIVFLYFFAVITEKGFLISPCNSAFKWVYLSFSPLLFTYLLFTAIFKASSDILLFCISFSWGWSCSLSPVQCHELPSYNKIQSLPSVRSLILTIVIFSLLIILLSIWKSVLYKKQLFISITLFSLLMKHFGS